MVKVTGKPLLKSIEQLGDLVVIAPNDRLNNLSNKKTVIEKHIEIQKRIVEEIDAHITSLIELMFNGHYEDVSNYFTKLNVNYTLSNLYINLNLNIDSPKYHKYKITLLDVSDLKDVELSLRDIENRWLRFIKDYETDSNYTEDVVEEIDVLTTIIYHGLQYIHLSNPDDFIARMKKILTTKRAKNKK